MKHKKPCVSVMEQSSNLLSKKHKWVFKKILKGAKSMGYICSWKVVDCFHFGVAHHRERLLGIHLPSPLVQARHLPSTSPVFLRHPFTLTSSPVPLAAEGVRQHFHSLLHDPQRQFGSSKSTQTLEDPEASSTTTIGTCSSESVRLDDSTD